MEDSIELAELYSLIEGHDSILTADHIIERNGLKEKLSKFSSKPNFMLGLKYTDIGEPVMAGIEDGEKRRGSRDAWHEPSALDG